MRVHLYKGSLALVRKSGVGQAVLHQKEMLAQAGIAVTTRWREKAEVIHLNTVFPDSVLAALLARKQGKKVIFYGHSTMEDFRNSFKLSNFFAPLFRRWICFCYGLGDIILTPTEYSKGLLQSYGLKRPIYAISNGIDTDFFVPSALCRARFREKYALREDEKVVLSVGHYIERKGILDFVELARTLPEIRFFWFGYTNLNLVPASVREAISSAPKNLVFPGYVNRDELRDAYCGCDVFAFLTREETEGIVVLEALACGIPTVLRDIPVYDGWLHDGEELYKADSLSDFREKVAGLLDGSLPALTAEGRKTAQDRSMANIGAKLRGIYQAEGFLSPSEDRGGDRKVGTRRVHS